MVERPEERMHLVTWISQGSQPSFYGVDVGVMRVGEPDGVATIRVRLRDDESGGRADVTADEPADLLGHGLLELLAVERPDGTRPARAQVRVSPARS